MARRAVAYLYERKYPGKDEKLDVPAEVWENVWEGGDGCRSDEVKLKGSTRPWESLYDS